MTRRSMSWRRPAAGAALALCGTLASIACDGGEPSDEGDDGSTGGQGSDEDGSGGRGSGGRGSGGKGSGEAGSNGEGGGAGDNQGPLPVYITGVRVWPNEGPALQYLKASHELDTNFTSEDFENAFETDGYAGVTIQDGYVLIGEEAAPFLRKYRITEDLEWEEVGEPLNFTDYYTDDGDGLNFYYQAQKQNDLFFFYGPPERTARLHYKAEEWRIIDTLEESNLPTRDGWLLRNQGNRTGVRDFHDVIVWPFVLFPDEEVGTTGTPESYLGVYDGESGEELDVLEPSCADLRHSTIDENGNLYFSTRDRSPLYGLYGDSEPNCIVKVKPDGTIDEDFGDSGEETIENLTGDVGLPGINFRYLGNGKATAMLLNVDALEGADFDGPLQREVLCQTQWCEESPETENPELWESYVIDLESKTAQRMTGYDANYPGYGNYRIYWNVDGVTYFMGYEKDGGTNLVIYELDPETAEVKLVGESPTPTEASHEYVQLARIR